MKLKFLIIGLLVFTSLEPCSVTNTKGIIILPEAINPYDRLISAVRQVESNGDDYSLNVKEQAVGPLQIRAVRLQHFNDLSGKNYELHEMFDFEKSKEIFMYFAVKYGFHDLETIAKKWNGSGSTTEEYWQKVKSKM